MVAAGDVVAAVPLAGGGDVPVAAATTLTAVVRSAAPVRLSLTLPDGFAERPAEGTVAGRAEYRADGVRLGVVRLVVAPEPPAAASSPAASSDVRRRGGAPRSRRPASSACPARAVTAAASS